MSEDVFQKVGGKDHVVLSCIRAGKNDVRQITDVTTLSNQQVNYRFRKLRDIDLIEIERVEEMVERVIDGKRQVFESPKQASLTDRGHEYFEWTERDQELGKYRDMNHGELVEQIHELEQRVENLEVALETFRKQVQRSLE